MDQADLDLLNVLDQNPGFYDHSPDLGICLKPLPGLLGADRANFSQVEPWLDDVGIIVLQGKADIDKIEIGFNVKRFPGGEKTL